MKRYSVQITDEALIDLENTYDYIAKELQAPESALGQYNRIANAILKLEIFPERFRVMQSEPERKMGLRRMVVDHYSVFYIVREEKVIVTSVLYSASDIENRLKKE